MKRLARTIVERMPELTVRRALTHALENVRLNARDVRQTILDLPVAPRGRATWAIVISAGPSLHRRKSVRRILESGYEGVVITSDGALGHCLREGLVPDYVVTLDPHPTRICRWFGDPELGSREDDDYFRRQDLDPHLRDDELERNRELIGLVNKHGRRIKAVVSTTVSPNVAKRCIESGMGVYWWNPIVDDVNNRNGLTQAIHDLNKAPCMVSGGNVGTAAWVFAHQIQRVTEVALVGMDFSYAPGTPFESTQYYTELVELFGSRAGDALIRVFNPYLRETWYADPAYYWYRQCFREMVAEAPCETYNCTEGGILFGKKIRFVRLSEFLRARKPRRVTE